MEYAIKILLAAQRRARQHFASSDIATRRNASRDDASRNMTRLRTTRLSQIRLDSAEHRPAAQRKEYAMKSFRGIARQYFTSCVPVLPHATKRRSTAHYGSMLRRASPSIATQGIRNEKFRGMVRLRPAWRDSAELGPVALDYAALDAARHRNTSQHKEYAIKVLAAALDDTKLHQARRYRAKRGVAQHGITRKYAINNSPGQDGAKLGSTRQDYARPHNARRNVAQQHYTRQHNTTQDPAQPHRTPRSLARPRIATQGIRKKKSPGGTRRDSASHDSTRRHATRLRGTEPRSTGLDCASLRFASQRKEYAMKSFPGTVWLHSTGRRFDSASLDCTGRSATRLDGTPHDGTTPVNTRHGAAGRGVAKARQHKEYAMKSFRAAGFRQTLQHRTKHGAAIHHDARNT